MELRGFEPLTPSLRTRCATGLRYSPDEVGYLGGCQVSNRGPLMLATPPSARLVEPILKAGSSRGTLC